ncbi:short-chain dehydrogenase TIC 32 [Tropilaelaps mercedesae]|uniref:Short-chain dehydrogenase TIC 32 n=1 Tax=Tropilaelaps mercedesae TaxID=418985 RepID=A0A1V9XYX5_9ACAR|nr:short-chain dehydrogenase TIC 32 [Tropilaelaps mercedesae]
MLTHFTQVIKDCKVYDPSDAEFLRRTRSVNMSERVWDVAEQLVEDKLDKYLELWNAIIAARTVNSVNVRTTTRCSSLMNICSPQPVAYALKMQDDPFRFPGRALNRTRFKVKAASCYSDQSWPVNDWKIRWADTFRTHLAARFGRISPQTEGRGMPKERRGALAASNIRSDVAM